MIRGLVQATAITFGWGAVLFAARSIWLDLAAVFHYRLCDSCRRHRRDVEPVIVQGEAFGVCGECSR